MPNKYKVEFIVVDDYEKLGEEPFTLEDIKESTTVELDNGLDFDGDISITYIKDSGETNAENQKSQEESPSNINDQIQQTGS